MNTIEIQLLSPLVKIPTRACADDAAFDIYTTVSHMLLPGERFIYSTGIVSSIPAGYFVKLFGRSGYAAKYGIEVLGGVIDSGYRGEWKVILVNTGHDAVPFTVGDRICQGVLLPVLPCEFRPVLVLEPSQRGAAGLGSTGN